MPVVSDFTLFIVLFYQIWRAGGNFNPFIPFVAFNDENCYDKLLRRTTMIEEFVSEMATLKEKADGLRGYL